LAGFIEGAGAAAPRELIGESILEERRGYNRLGMGEASGERKRERREARRQAGTARRRQRRIRRGAIAAAILLVPFLWILDRAGGEEVVDAHVVQTRPWRHRPQQGGTSHIHTNATLLIRGLNRVSLRQADGLEKGQQVPVRIRRGLLSGWPYFLELVNASPPEAEPAPEPADAPPPEGEEEADPQGAEEGDEPEIPEEPGAER
jgi:hypothetical protein